MAKDDRLIEWKRAYLEGKKLGMVNGFFYGVLFSVLTIIIITFIMDLLKL